MQSLSPKEKPSQTLHGGKECSSYLDHQFSLSYFHKNPPNFPSVASKTIDETKSFTYSNVEDTSLPPFTSSFNSNSPFVDIPVDILIDIARMHGFVNPPRINFTLSSYDLLANFVEFRIHQVIQNAIKFMRHSCRPSLHEVLAPQDIKNALRHLRMEPLLGFSRNSSYRFVSMDLAEGVSAIKREYQRVHFTPPVYTSTAAKTGSVASQTHPMSSSFSSPSFSVTPQSVGTTHVSRPFTSSVASNSKEISRFSSHLLLTPPSATSYPYGGKVRVVELVYQDSKIPTPCEPSLSLHWLAIAGEIPITSRNLCHSSLSE
ncbi:hypothetical protein IE077_002390, partial [Cardiosporidium cionae]